MNRSRIIVAAAVSVMFAVPAFGASSDGSGGSASVKSDRVVADLQAAADRDRSDAMKGNKNNPAFGYKAAQVDKLIERIQGGEQVDPKEIDQAMAPVHIP